MSENSESETNWDGAQEFVGDIARGFAEAEAKAGAREIGGNNSGPFVEKYLNANHPDQITHRGEPWCCAFYLWCWMQGLRTVGHDLPFAFTRSVGELWERLESHGKRWQVVGKVEQAQQDPAAFDLKPGDAVLWDFNGNGSPDHVNMLHHVDADGVLYTIGGNEGSEDSGAPVRVKKRGRIGEVRALFGFGRVLCNWNVP